MWIAAVALIVGGIAIVAAAAMGRAGQLSRQGWVGIRTKTTMTSDTTWYAAQEAGAGWVMAGGVVMAMGGVVTLLIDAENTAGIAALITAVVALIPILIGGSRGQAAARRLL